ncbi:MAG: SDR family oxidoreductase [Thermoplasmata archaeon]|nr:SDR family oxidoreductase [Thermoplasmata archaeon]
MTNPEAPRPVALVTGASRGLGRVVSEVLASEGWDLVLVARRDGPLTELARELTGRTLEVRTVPGDVSSPELRTRVIGVVAEFGRLDLLVNNASELGPSPLKPLTELSVEELRRIMEVNLLAPLALVTELRPYLRVARGLVVNISSDAAVGGYPGWGGYGASKAALDLATRTLAGELRPEGIRLVSVDPGDMRTEMHQAAFPGEDISDRPLPEATLPFWLWLLSQDRERVTGHRFQAQSERWEVPA